MFTAAAVVIGQEGPFLVKFVLIIYFYGFWSFGSLIWGKGLLVFDKLTEYLSINKSQTDYSN